MCSSDLIYGNGVSSMQAPRPSSKERSASWGSRRGRPIASSRCRGRSPTWPGARRSARTISPRRSSIGRSIECSSDLTLENSNMQKAGPRAARRVWRSPSRVCLRSDGIEMNRHETSPRTRSPHVSLNLVEDVTQDAEHIDIDGSVFFRDAACIACRAHFGLGMSNIRARAKRIAIRRHSDICDRAI